jgi:hypothetical protein
MKLSLISFFATFLLCSQSFANKIPMETGLWEVTNTTQFEGGIPGLPSGEELKQLLAQMPPEAKAELEKAINNKGMTFTNENCVTEEDLKKLDTNFVDANCTMKRPELKANKMTYEFTCSEPKSQGKGEMNFKNGKEYEAVMSMDGEEDGKKVKFKVVSKGKWLKKDCPKNS